MAPSGSARLPEYVHQVGNDFSSGARDPGGQANPGDACTIALHGWHRPGFLGQNFSIRIHHDRLRRNFRLPRADFFRHHPEADSRESQARFIGYGSMLMESFVGIMAMIAACVLQPGVYFAINSPAGIVGTSPAAATADDLLNGGIPLPPGECTVCQPCRGTTLFARTGGAPSLAVGMAHIFAAASAALLLPPSGITSRSCSRRCSS